MRLGIDFGTTRVVVAAADRGNYPVLSFETPEGPIDAGPEIEERYVCTAAGTVVVTIRNVTAQYQREYAIGCGGARSAGSRRTSGVCTAVEARVLAVRGEPAGGASGPEATSRP